MAGNNEERHRRNPPYYINDTTEEQALEPVRRYRRHHNHIYAGAARCADDGIVDDPAFRHRRNTDLVLGRYTCCEGLKLVTCLLALLVINAFDLIVTVALGSTLATILLSSDVVLAEGLTALAVLILMQYAIAWLSVRSQTVSRLVKSEPVLLVYQGRLLFDALRRERVVDAEIWGSSAMKASPTSARSRRRCWRPTGRSP